MLNVPSPSFPVPSSQQRVSSGGRSKTPLKPGRSLMDWIKVKSSGKDLTGLRGRLIEVTEEELAKHNKKDDCWICIRGLVYNVTPYMEFHPGGEEELMKAAGADGTQLFDQVHRWVNYESMLKECLLGRMAVKHASSLKGMKSAAKKELSNGDLFSRKFPPETDKLPHPRYDWFQTDSTVTVVIYTKQRNVSSDHVTVDYHENIFRGEVTIDNYSYLLLIELSHTIQNFEVNASGKTGNIEMILQKKNHIVWENLGNPLEGHNTFINISQREIYYRQCRLSSLTDVNHNTRLFCFELPQSCHLRVPVGHHVYLKLTISGTEVVKPYTPVSEALVTDLQPSQTNGQYIYMMIKIYPDGSFTPHINTLAVGDFVYVSNPRGSYRLTQMEGMEEILLVAAGTGFTPMVKLLRHVLKDTSSLRKVKLFFFNKTEDDILWRDQLENLCFSDKRFEVHFILSEPSESWIGYKGQISTPLLSEAAIRSKKNVKVLICICGPGGFIDQGIRSLEELGFSQEDIFVFRE